MPDKPRSANPIEWSQEEVDEFSADAEPAEIAEVIKSLVADGGDRALEVLGFMLESRHVTTFEKGVPSQLAVFGLLSMGARGVEFLGKSLLGSRVRYRANVLHMLWRVSRDETPAPAAAAMVGPIVAPYAEDRYPDETVDAAARVVRDVFAEATTNPVAFELVAGLMNKVAIDEMLLSEGGRAPSLMQLFVEASIRLSPSVLDEFARLIAAEEREECYQQFLAANPVLLDPLAAEVIPKQRLGLELATDYAVRRHDGRWVLVEIEKPQDPLFTAGNDFRAEFTHAFGQVIDFNRWVDANVAYAQKHMPSITAPRGLLLMGRRSDLTASQEEKLEAFASNSQRIDVVTFDDVLAAGRNLYRSLRHDERPSDDRGAHQEAQPADP